MSSPEQLDRLMQVTSRQAWMPLVSMGFLVAVASTWSVVGRIPLTVTGSGVLIRPRHVVQLQSVGGGQLLTLNIKPGDVVRLGQVLATIDRIGTIEAEDRNTKLESLAYFADSDGKQIKPGMTVQVTPSVVKRDRFGGIVGVVTNVSPFPVTTDDIIAQVGNEDLAKSLANSNAACVQVFVQLQKDPNTVSGYKWSYSNGPALDISSGTTTQVRVKVGEVAPISYIIPIFRSWTGIY